MNRELFSPLSTTATFLSAASSFFGQPVLWDVDKEAKAVHLKYTFAGTSQFSTWYRNFNGKKWGPWNELKLNDSSLTYQHSSASATTGLLEFNMLLQAGYAPGMRGVQFKAVRDSGSGNITFDQGYVTIEKV